MVRLFSFVDFFLFFLILILSSSSIFSIDVRIEIKMLCWNRCIGIYRLVNVR